MGSYGGSGGGRTRVGTKVWLNVYDLAGANGVLYPVGLGLHHSGVEILGVEYSFASGGGIFEASPRVAPGARFREQVYMGIYDGGSTELKRVLDDLQQTFGPGDYHLIRKNCNSFCNALCRKLLRKPIPSYVNRVADIGVCCNCLLPKKLLEEAPVGDPNRKLREKAIALSRTNTAVKPAFSGPGTRLGGSVSSQDSGWTWSSSGSNSSSKKNSKPEDELTDRREKVRRAALARLENNLPPPPPPPRAKSPSPPPPPPPPRAKSPSPPPPPPPPRAKSPSPPPPPPRAKSPSPPPPPPPRRKQSLD